MYAIFYNQVMKIKSLNFDLFNNNHFKPVLEHAHQPLSIRVSVELFNLVLNCRF